MDDYKQCRLSLNTKDGVKKITSWLPLQFAKKGRILKLKNSETGKWETGWEVKKVYSLRLKEQEVKTQAEAYKHQREVSNI